MLAKKQALHPTVHFGLRRHLCVKERNLLLTEMAWRTVPKDLGEQEMMGLPRGNSKEEDVHRLRYNEVRHAVTVTQSSAQLYWDVGMLPGCVLAARLLHEARLRMHTCRG